MESYVGYCNDENVRRISSSGGLFYEIARMVIEDGGVVCAAGYSCNFEVYHRLVDSLENLDDCIGSKYVQSNIQDIFYKIETILGTSKYVLFVGTPCQVAALRKYIGNNHYLILISLACHGVPSPYVWCNYLRKISEHHKINKVNFRCKDRGWNNYRLSISFDSKKTLSYPRILDPYMRAFLSDYNIRPSCYGCNHKYINSEADIILGDAWGGGGGKVFCNDF